MSNPMHLDFLRRLTAPLKILPVASESSLPSQCLYHANAAQAQQQWAEQRIQTNRSWTKLTFEQILHPERQCPADRLCLSWSRPALPQQKFHRGFHGPPHVPQKVQHRCRSAFVHESQSDSQPHLALRVEDPWWCVTQKSQSDPEILP
eukprot:Skav236842  [mRNA]  locus=scaffold1027:192852:193295:- [translate_table: standard]